MLTKVWVTIREFKLILPGELVIVGVSGGPDSLTLLHVLNQLSKEGDFALHVAHLNHSFRGQEAEDEARWVQKIAESWGIPCTLAKEDVPDLARKLGLSPQEAGHKVRKEFFFSLLGELQGQKIALGQQADDQAETILMHLLKGAGTEGLQGIRPLNTPYIRPLLFITRMEIEEYCKNNGLEPRRDPSNFKNLYLRNRIRNQLMPWLKENINPNLVTGLQKTATIMQSEEDYWRGVILAFTELHLSIIAGQARLDLNDFLQEPVAVQRRIIRYCCQEITGQQGPAYVHVEEIRKLAVGQVGKRLILPGGLTIQKEYRHLSFIPSYQEVAGTGIAPRLLAIPGETLVPETGQIIKATITQEKPRSGIDKVWFPMGANMLATLYCRSRQPGDWLNLRGMVGRKKLKDLFIDRKVPRLERDKVLVIAEGSEVLWIPGYAVSERTEAVSPQGNYLVLEMVSDSANGL